MNRNNNSETKLKKILTVVLLLFLVICRTFGQSLLTPEDAVSIALKNSYDILISKTSSDIDKTNNTAGNAGMLPDIGLNAADNFAYSNISQDLSDNTSVHTTGAHSNSFSANVVLDWTLFDGGKMFVTRKKLNEIDALGEIQFRDQVNQTLYNVILAYYDVVRQKQELESINEVIRFNRERVNILEASFNAGLVPKTDLLQSQVDLNVYLENAILQETVIVTSKRTLNQMLSRDPDTQFEVIDSIELNYVPDKNALVNKLFDNNTQLLSFRKQLEISKLSVKEYIAQRYPWINFNVGYYFLNANSTSGTVLKNQVYGPQVGGSLTLPLYNGSNIKRQINVARLQEKTAGYNLDATQLQVNTQLLNALTNYEHAMQLMDLEKQNTILAKENLTISMRRLELGQTTSLEVHQAQESYVQSVTRKILFEYSAKAAETRLKQLVSAL